MRCDDASSVRCQHLVLCACIIHLSISVNNELPIC